MSSRESSLNLWTLLVQYLRPQWAKVLFLTVLLLTSTGLELWVPQVMRDFLDAAERKEVLSTLTQFAVIYLVVAVIKQVLGAAALYLGADVGWTATNRLRLDLMRHVFTLDMAFHKDHTPGEMIERIDGDITALSNFFAQFSIRVFGALLLLLGVLVLFWKENPWVGLGMTVFVAFALLVLFRVRRIAVSASEQEREANAKMYGFIEERLAGLEDLRSLGAGKHTLFRFQEVSRLYFDQSTRAHFGRAGIWLIMLALFAVGFIVALSFGVGLYLAGVISLGTAYLFFQYMSLIEAPIDQVTQQFQELQKVIASVQRINALFELKSNLPQGVLELPTEGFAVDVQDLSFGYEENPVLHNISFALKPGQVLGLLGRTGSGKTTLTRLLLGFYESNTGSIRLGGIPTHDLKRSSLRRGVGVVTQDIQLFHASIRDNLTFFDPHVSDRHIEAALRDIGLSSWLERQPQGLDTLLESGGSGLSAGEGQLLALARIFLADPGLVILDEPSSRLDLATEMLLERAIDRLLQGRTAIIIAHRLETIERVDQVLILSEGKVLEWGPKEQLLSRPQSHFSVLLRAGEMDLELA
ncbi:MAG: ABC transporter ATP-binding protein [Deinococcaceae bacterium]